jgi:hypothetical protein
LNSENISAALRHDVNRRIVTKFLDSLVRTPMKERSKPPSVPINDHMFPEFFSPNYSSEEKRIEEQLLELKAAGAITITYRDKFDTFPLYLRKATVVFCPEAEEICRVILEIPSVTARQRWIEAVKAAGLPASIENTLSVSAPITIEGRDYANILERIRNFIARGESGVMVRQASAWMFWGLSKVLDSRQDLWSLLGLLQAPIHLLVYLPKDATAMLFIENRQTYEYAKTRPSIFSGFVLVYSAGFAGTAMRLRERASVSLFIDSSGCHSQSCLERIERWLFEDGKPEVYFWGDLDYSGVAIFVSLLRNFHETKPWEPGYNHMFTLVKAGGHSGIESNKQGQTKVYKTGNSYMDKKVLPLIEEHGFYDQEGILL